MKANEIYKKTMKFVWLKLALGGVLFLGAMLLGGIFLLIATAIDNDTVTYVLFLVWIIAVVGMDNAITHYFGYLIKAGHIAIVSHIVTTGEVPENQYESAKNMVTERFAVSSVYFLQKRSVSI